MSSDGYITAAILFGFFCWATWSGWARSAGFASFQGAFILCIVAGFGLGYFMRTLWDLVKLLGWRG